MTETFEPIAMRSLLNDAFFEDLIQQAAQSPRLRAHCNLHQHHDEPVQRMCIALLPGTYIRPHCHQRLQKWELMLVLRGNIMLLSYDQTGQILSKQLLSAGQGLSGLEMTPDVWHSLYPVNGAAVMMEVKNGPYTPSTAEDFAAWSPAEGNSQVAKFVDWQQQAQIGDHWPPKS